MKTTTVRYTLVYIINDNVCTVAHVLNDLPSFLWFAHDNVLLNPNNFILYYIIVCSFDSGR